jgi:hypothetical protein
VYTAGEGDFRRCRVARDRTGRRYNIGVATSAPKPVSEDRTRHRHHAYAAEATGLLLIAIVLLILTLVRYWSYINWSMR